MDYAGVGKEKINRARETAEDLIDQASEMKERLGRGANDAWKESKRAYARLQDSAEDALDGVGGLGPLPVLTRRGRDEVKKASRPAPLDESTPTAYL